MAVVSLSRLSYVRLGCDQYLKQILTIYLLFPDLDHVFTFVFIRISPNNGPIDLKYDLNDS